MFKVGDYIVHGRSGVCKVEDITTIDLSGADKDALYYVLAPIRTPDGRVFYPVDGNKVVVRPILTRQQAEEIVSKIDDIGPIEIKNDRQREVEYKEVISSCDCQRLIGFIKTLLTRNSERQKLGKRATYVDDRYLKEAKENLYGEFALALDMDQDKVESYFAEHMSK